MKHILALSLVAAFLIFPATTWGQRGPGPGPGPGGGPGGGPGQGGWGPPPFQGPGPGGGGGHQLGGMGAGMGAWWNHPGVRTKLEITDEQVEELSKQRLETETSLIEATAKAKIAYLQLQDQVRRKDPNQETIDKCIDDVAANHKERIKALVSQRLSLRKILDDKQLEKIEKFIAQRKARGFRPPPHPSGRDPRDMRPQREGKGPDGPKGRRNFGMGPGPEGGPPGPPPHEGGEEMFDQRPGPPPPPPGSGPGPERFGDLPPLPPPSPENMAFEPGDMPPPPEPGMEGLPELGEALDSLMADYN